MNDASMQAIVDVKTLEAEARRLHEDILGKWGNLGNVWRTAWAMDTLLDAYRILGRKAAPGDSEKALDALDPTALGNWWDDFGWIGIAALRAAEQNIFPGDSEKFLKIAINAWAYMYGSGWSATGDKAYYPFADGLPGWNYFPIEKCTQKCTQKCIEKCREKRTDGCTEKCIDDKVCDNIGTLNVWAALPKKCDDPGLALWIEGQKPRFAPGGAWNSPISLKPDTDDHELHPILRASYAGKTSYLNPAQNTVTNGLFSLLSLRILRASSTTAFKPIFDASKLNLSACAQAWKNQTTWLNAWCSLKDDEQSLTAILHSSFGAILIRERVSTFAPQGPNEKMFWDESYKSDLVWTGDQGLMLGVLREGAAAGITEPFFKRSQDIVTGVFEAGFVDYHYTPSTARPRLLQPWIALDATGDGRFEAKAPGDDTGDYLTGIAVFMRYLLQAYEATPNMLPTGSAQTILRAAAAICTPGFATRPLQSPGACDGYYDEEAGGFEGLTPLINRLSILLMAIAILRRQP